ncbi:MAG: FAD-dependent oxidoreductase [Candidatus Lambdaproteobacteria bacterium]|nr:FAD-dependent oxidoreductase [Candidatus Lambdaproteobacteria bacterium]
MKSADRDRLPADPLLAPLRLGRREAPNRIVFGAHLTNFAAGNSFGARHLAFYAARAAGGAGVIVTEALTVHPLDWPYEHVPFGYTDGIVPALARLVETLRRAVLERATSGAPPLVLAQLNHTGGQCAGRLLRQSPWAPSAVADVASRRMPRVMEPEQIAAVQRGFAGTAARVMAAGLDGVELNAGQHSLLRQFLSPLTNQRDDDHGGSPENRLRLLADVVADVRAALGADAVLGVKLCGDELAPWGGLTPEDAGRIARALVERGGVDYLSVEIGGPYSAHVTAAGMPTPEAHAAHLAGTVRVMVRQAVGGRVPVLAEGRILSAATARAVLAAGQADGVVMTHALLAEPDLPALLAAQQAGRDAAPARPHIGMARYYAVRGDWNRPLGDLANPRAGREALLPPVVQRERAAPVLVIGGGPAGCEAAITLARQGAAVRIVEAGEALGGLAEALARTVPSRAEFARLVEYHRAMVARLGIAFQLGRRIAGHEPWMADFARILVATGARAALEGFAALDGPATSAATSPSGGEIGQGRGPSSPTPQGGGGLGWGPSTPSPQGGGGLGWGGRIITPRDLLAGTPLPAPARGAALVYDEERGHRMGNAVEALLARGWRVDVATDDFQVGRGLVEGGELDWFNRVGGQGVGWHPRLRLKALRPEGVVCADRFSGAERIFPGVALLVIARHEVPEDGLVEAIGAHHPRVEAVGDALAPRLMGEAILTAHQAALAE